MKKTYIQPTIEAITINFASALLAGSSLGVGSGTIDAGSALGHEDDDYEW